MLISKLEGDILNNTEFLELLSPAGSKESVYAAVNNGCNAIYLGGKRFNARKYASNFSDEDLKEVIDYCHLRDVKVLITLNILYKNTEINDVLLFVSEMYAAGADAFIVQDIGIFSILKSNFPSIKLHASTQMTIHNIQGVNFLHRLGFARIVLSRELSLDEIENICKNTKAEIEIFIHGALCVSYSGRCLISSMIGERSGNRGCCAQPCRLKYSLLKGNSVICTDYLLSPKDIMTAPIINELIHAGINTFKIEGRMKSSEYVALVTKTYRKYIDLSLENNFKPNGNDIKKLTQIFNRGGDSSEGYLKTWSGKSMISKSPKSSGILVGKVENYNRKTENISIKLYEDIISGDGIEIWTEKEPHIGTNISKPALAGDTITLKIKGSTKKGDLVYKSYDKQLNDELKKDCQNNTRQITVNAYVIAVLGKPVSLILQYGKITAKCTGVTAAEAENQPLTPEILKEKLSKTGNTPFKIEFKEITCGSGIYIPISELNSLRRKAVGILSEKITESFKRDKIQISYTPKERIVPNRKYITVHVSTKEQFEEALMYDIKRIYLEFNNIFYNNIDYCVSKAHYNNKELYMCFPRIYRQPSFKDFKKIFSIFEKSEADGYLIRNYGDIKTDKKLISDYTFNIFNSAGLEAVSQIFSEITLSPELTARELSGIAADNTEIFTYGRLTLMTTHQCPIGLYAAKKTSSRFCPLKGNTDSYFLKDRLNICFPIQRDCFSCTAAILNSAPVCTLQKFQSIKNIPSKYFRLTFTDESPSLTGDIIYSHINLLNGGIYDKRVEKTINNIKDIGFTNGHFFRGVT